MTLPASITTNLFPDFKNSPIGPFARFLQEAQDTSDAVQVGVGLAGNASKAAQSFQTATAGELASVDVYVNKVGSPTDNMTVGLYSDNGGEPGSLLASATVIVPASAGTNPKYVRSTFFSPYPLVASTTYWLQLEKLGSTSATDYYKWYKNASDVYANGEAKRFLASWVSATGDFRFKFNIRTSGRYQPCVDKTNNKIRMFKSTDGGNTWSEQDSADAPGISTSATFKSFSAIQVDTFINVCRITDGNGGFQIFRYNTGTDQWETSSHSTTTSMPVTASVAGVASLLATFKPLEANWDYVVACNGQAETVMGSARRRIKVKRRTAAGAWQATPGYDLVGSPNTPDLTTLPGTAVDYDLRAVLMDGNGTWHGWWTQSDDSNLRHRQFNENITFSTANLMGSTPLTTSNSLPYSMGQPTNYYRNGEWHIAAPVESSGAIKVTRVRAVDAATQNSWTNTTVIASDADATNCNLAVLVADNEQGGKLFLVYKKASDGKLYYTHDQANDSWVPEQELHPGTKTVGAISGGVMVDSIGICYLDTAPATDDLKFDSL